MLADTNVSQKTRAGSSFSAWLSKLFGGLICDRRFTTLLFGLPCDFSFFFVVRYIAVLRGEFPHAGPSWNVRASASPRHFEKLTYQNLLDLLV